ncbi:hypothetical protein [Thalassobius sp. Cn5-15]|uniref:hypothetical protein n=1 Tax=Thalassobius sp. Cn5-15 TaxID=2917763 RepID=UPI001EF23D8D|nr:hypothetical protein [Thalassobius sp. Cn5-15]MCG7493170.1 hypothetical protein [Thalassobius sp. Cn5-15]
MKKLFLASTALVLTAGMSFAQTATGGGIAPANASAESNTAATANETGSIFNSAEALDSAGGGNDETAIATAGEAGNGARARVNLSSAITAQGQTTGGISATVAQQAANANLQFQVGNNNQAVNLQAGVRQESATLQRGDRNDAIISQTQAGNEAAISQYGDDNMNAIIQDGIDNGAASAQVGDFNVSTILQAGDHNIAAHSQFGLNNNAMTFQNDGDNTAAQVQVGDGNASLISQGGGASQTLAAIDGATRNVAIPAGLVVGGAVAGAASLNSAASIQLGDGNSSAIIQQGNGNEAVNYQNSN